MGALTNFAQYQTEIANPAQRTQDSKASLTTVAGLSYSMWLTTPYAGAAPGGTARVCTNATVGALGQKDSTTASLYLAQVAGSLQNSGYVLVCDRLVYISGFSGTVTTAQTMSSVNVTTGTRYTDGIGVFAGIEIYTAVGTTATTISMNYNDSEGNTGLTSELTTFGGNNYGAKVSRLIVLPPAGNKPARGVKSVASVTVTGTTSTAGNFGVTLFKPLFAMPIPNIGSQQLLFDGLYSNGACIPEILDGACLFYVMVSGVTSTGQYQDAIRFIEV